VSGAAVVFDRVGFSYPGAASPTLDGVSFEVGEGELALVVGATGSGKSTLLRAVSGLVPRFSGGLLTGTVTVAGRRTCDHPPRDLADVVGTVGQDPAATFVADTVEDEVAHVMENLAVPVDAMRRRLEDTLDLLGIAGLRHRNPGKLSGGQQQRVAIAAVMAAGPRVLVLDEPTSALDPAAADEVLSALQRLVHDVGLTVVVAEHRLERVVQFADVVVHVGGPGEPVRVGPPREMFRPPAPRPPVVRLGEVAGWPEVPLTVREARRMAGPLRRALDPDGRHLVGEPSLGEPSAVASPAVAPPAPSSGGDPPVAPATVTGLWGGWGGEPVLRGVDLELRRGEVMALMGRNGAGKSTLLAHLAGLRPPVRGRVLVEGRAPAGRRPAELIRSVGLVPQDPSILLFAESVDRECALSDADSGLAPGTTAGVLGALVGRMAGDLHPRDLSEGQRLALALAVVLAPSPGLVCLDEPTRGLDQDAKDHLSERLGALAAAGRAVVLATHDVEMVAGVADRVVVMADGAVVDDGPARRVVCHSPVFAPQVARVLAPEPWLTVAEVAGALESVR
jgi:energy-coupling factor transport system ATP-binding protein